MYRCEFCDKNSIPGEISNMIVTKTRKKQYDNGSEITQGWEIVQEKRICTNCYKDLR